VIHPANHRYGPHHLSTKEMEQVPERTKAENSDDLLPHLVSE
jgi:hypothetical protein